MHILLLPVVTLLATAVFGQSVTTPPGPAFQPITPKQRAEWFRDSTIGVPSMIGGTFSAGLGTWRNDPDEYGPHWDGFGKRYGMRLAGVATSNAMEASLGVLWGEDPRYFRARQGDPFKSRVWNVVKMTFVAKNSLGENAPAYARYLSIYGSNYLSNTWRADGEATGSEAAMRVGFGFLGRMAGNAFSEFWPDAKRKVLRRR